MPGIIHVELHGHTSGDHFDCAVDKYTSQPQGISSFYDSGLNTCASAIHVCKQSRVFTGMYIICTVKKNKGQQQGNSHM